VYKKQATHPTKFVVKTTLKAALAAFGIMLLALVVTQRSTRSMCGWKTTTPAQTELCTGTELSSVDFYGRIMYNVVVSTVDEPLESIAKEESPLAVKIPKHEKKLSSIEAIPNTGWRIPTEDEDMEEEHGQITGWLTKKLKVFMIENVFQSPLLFPIKDSPAVWTNIEKAQAIMKAAGGPMLPKPVADWNGVDVTSDSAIAQMCFAGVAGGRVRRLEEERNDGSVYMVDFSEMHGLPVRFGFERFGATAFFNAAQDLTAIRWRAMDVTPGHAKWEHAKWVFRCSALIGTTANEHLLQSHLMIANAVATSSRENLPSHHPVRRFLKPFTHRTPTVNVGAQQFLTQEFSLLHRATALSFEGLQSAFKLSLETTQLKARPMEFFKEILDKGAEANTNFEFPYAEDGADLYAVIHSFTKNFCQICYPDIVSLRADKDLKQFWAGLRANRGDASGLPIWTEVTVDHVAALTASFIFQVTGIHHVVGNVAEYLINPKFSSTRIRADSEISDVEASHYGLLVATLTGMKGPFMMGNYKHLLTRDEKFKETSALMDNFQRDLSALADKIDARNADRKWKFYGMHPKRLLSSISI